MGIAALAAILGLAAITTGAIYAAGSALPGDLLYPVEQAVEQVRLGIASPGQAFGLRLDFAEKRLGEAEQLMQKGDDEHMLAALDDYYQIVSELTQMVSSVSSVDDQALLDRMNTTLALQQARLEALLSAARPEAQAGIAKAIEASKLGQERAVQTIEDNGGGRPESTSMPGQTTYTSVPLPANTQTNTAVPLTTHTPEPTNVEPTDTPIPTNVPIPTDTPRPANTPAPTCDNVSMVWNGITGTSAGVTVTNTNNSPIALTKVTISWRENGPNLKHIKFTGVLWSGDAAPPSFSTGVSGPSTVLDPAKQTSTDLVFQFVSRASPKGYAITVNIDIGCVLTFNN